MDYHPSLKGFTQLAIEALPAKLNRKCINVYRENETMRELQFLPSRGRYDLSLAEQKAFHTYCREGAKQIYRFYRESVQVRR